MSGGDEMNDGEVLTVNDLHAFYGPSHIVQGVSLSVRRGQIVALLGRNGVGKTTTLRAIMGLVPSRRGSVRLEGKEIVGLPTHELSRLGLSYVPEDRRVFRGLTVWDNLRLAMLGRRLGNERGQLEAIYELFPILRERGGQEARTLSGGEQQMLAIARALIGEPKVILVDEPTQGLAPTFVERIADALAKVRERGISILLVEQNVPLALQMADVAYIMDKGRIALSGPASEVRESPLLKELISV